MGMAAGGGSGGIGMPYVDPAAGYGGGYALGGGGGPYGGGSGMASPGGAPLPAGGGGGGIGAAHPSLAQLAPQTQQRIADLISSSGGALSYGHFDRGLSESLLRLPPAAQLGVLDEVGRNDLGTVRNPPAYIMGICKRYLTGGARPGGGGGPPGGSGGGGFRLI